MAASSQEGEATQQQQQQQQTTAAATDTPQWRSRYNTKPIDLVKNFQDIYSAGTTCYVEGARGFSGPYTIHEVLGGGRYKLRDSYGNVLRNQYDEAVLRRNLP